MKIESFHEGLLISAVKKRIHEGCPGLYVIALPGMLIAPGGESLAECTNMPQSMLLPRLS